MIVLQSLTSQKACSTEFLEEKKLVVTLMERKNEKHYRERIRKYHSMKLTAKKLNWTQDHVIFTIMFSGFTSQ